MLHLAGVSYRHPTAATAAVAGVDLTVSAGELVLLTGPTGCGKSTLLRLAAGLLQRHGRGNFAGTVTVDGADPAAMAPSERVGHVALVGQDPDDQRVSATVGDEIAFAAESAGMDAATVDARVGVLAEALGLPGGPGREVSALSSGQRQRLSVAAALAAGARLLLLDEPLAHLDPTAARELVERLRALADGGDAVVVVEHRLEALWRAADRVVLMRGGLIVSDAPPARTGLAALRTLGLTAPTLDDLRERLAGAPEEDEAGLRAQSAAAVGASGVRSAAVVAAPQLVAATALTWTFPGGDGLHGVDLAVGAGERVALVGPNGAGKSTLLRALAGELRGGVRRRGRLVAVPANPDLGLFTPSVRDELEYAPRELGLGGAPGRASALAEAFGLTELLDRPPQALSRGQRLRVAVAAALAAEPAVLLLDEPTAGQDLEQVERLMAAIHLTLGDGALVFATHDLALAHRHGTRVVVLDHGRVLGDGAPEPTLRAASPPLELPPLLEWCAATGLPFGAPAAVAASARRAGLAAPDAPLERRRSLRLMPVPGAVTGYGAQPIPWPTTGLDPRTRLALVGLVGLLAVCAEGSVALGVLALAAGLAFVRHRPSGRTLGGAALMLLAITWSTVLAQGLFYGDEPRVALVSFGPLTLWRQGVTHGLVQSLRFIAMTLAGFALAASTPPERLFAALRALRVPFGLSFLVVTALRFVPDVASEWQAVRTARARRGHPAWRRAPWAWVALETALLAPVLARTMRRARALAESLDARGFDPVAPRAVRRPLRFRVVDRVTLGAAASLGLGVAAARALFVLYVTDTWYHPALRSLYAMVRAW